MRKMIRTVAAAMAALTVMTGCQAKPKDDAGQTTTQEVTQETAPMKRVELEEIYTAVKTAYGEEYIPGAEYDEQAMTDIFGISPDLYVSYIAEGPMISVHVDQFVLMEAKEGKGEEVEKLLNAYRDGQLDGAMQYPMNLPKIEASQVVRYGDYVFFVMLGSPTMESQEQGEEEALESAKEQNQKAIDLIDGFFAS